MKYTLQEHTRHTKTEHINKELSNLNKLYKTRKAALEKMSKAILEEKEALINEDNESKHQCFPSKTA